jgi:hypothetical protein
MNDPLSVKAKESTFKDVQCTIVHALGSTLVYDLAKAYCVKQKKNFLSP